ncbi:uncharacterized protein LOC5520145 [Nematostella vectensis]|uniref:uncharacterized protein LOC5520145 n=1 Tax=Nematostella vectensis TaxID=45351 RepID=UPI00207774A3|nr:uncharacterized protein LOC5520145 [Nematostella vectensis]
MLCAENKDFHPEISHNMKLEGFRRVFSVRPRLRTADVFTQSPWFRSEVLLVFRSLFTFYLMTWWLCNIATNMQNGKLFLSFHYWTLTLTAFYFAIGANLTCIAIIDERDKRRIRRRMMRSTSRDRLEERLEVRNDVIVDGHAGNDGGHVEVERRSAEDRKECSCLFWKRKKEYKVNNPTTCEESTTQDQLKTYHKILWVLYNITADTTVVMVIAYYLGFFEESEFTSLHPLSDYVIGCAFIVVETLICGVPVYLGHALYSVLYITVYVCVSAVYWDVEGRPLYRGLDFVSPSIALLLVCKAIGMGCLAHAGFFILSLLRYLAVTFFCCN